MQMDLPVYAAPTRWSRADDQVTSRSSLSRSQPPRVQSARKMTRPVIDRLECISQAIEMPDWNFCLFAAFDETCVSALHKQT